MHGITGLCESFTIFFVHQPDSQVSLFIDAMLMLLWSITDQTTERHRINGSTANFFWSGSTTSK